MKASDRRFLAENTTCRRANFRVIQGIEVVREFHNILIYIKIFFFIVLVSNVLLLRMLAGLFFIFFVMFF